MKYWKKIDDLQLSQTILHARKMEKEFIHTLVNKSHDSVFLLFSSRKTSEYKLEN